jgi:hypothetical protein
MENKKMGILKIILGKALDKSKGSKTFGIKEMKIKHAVKIKFNKYDKGAKEEGDNQGHSESN